MLIYHVISNILKLNQNIISNWNSGTTEAPPVILDLLKVSQTIKIKYL